MTRTRRSALIEVYHGMAAGHMAPVPRRYRRLVPLYPRPRRRQLERQQALLVRPPRGLGAPGLRPAAPPHLGATP